MSRIVILGAGVMGSAFSTPLADNGHMVRLVGTHLDGDVIEEVHQSHFHPDLGSYLAESVEPYSYDRLGEVIAGTDLVVLGVNSHGVDWAAEMLGPVLPEGVPVLMLTKGLAGDGKGIRILPETLKDGLPPDRRDSVDVLAVGGPSIASELAARRHTCVYLAGSSQIVLDQVAGLMRTPYYHVWTSTDEIGVETCVALKNLYALAVGLVSGLLEKDGQADNRTAMHNLSGAVFGQALWETAYLVEHLGGEFRSVLTLPGAGDFYTTCQGGRNSRMGRWLGLGMRYSLAKSQHMPDDTVEGAELAVAIGPTVEALIERGDLDAGSLPLIRMLIDVVVRDQKADIPWDDFFAV